MPVSANDTRYTVPRLAEMLGLSIESVYRGIQRGDIPHLRVGRRIVLPKAAIDKWMAQAGTTAA